VHLTQVVTEEADLTFRVGRRFRFLRANQLMFGKKVAKRTARSRLFHTPPTEVGISSTKITLAETSQGAAEAPLQPTAYRPSRFEVTANRRLGVASAAQPSQ